MSGNGKLFKDIEVSADVGRIRLYVDEDNYEEFTSSELLMCLNDLCEENRNLKETLWEAEVNYIEERNEYSIDIEKDIEYLKKEWDREYWNDDSSWEYWK